MKKNLLIGLSGVIGFFILINVIGLSNPKVESEKIVAPSEPTAQATAAPTDSLPDPTPAKTFPPESLVKPKTQPTSTPKSTIDTTTSGSTGIKPASVYSGGDKDCGDFSTHAEAQTFFETQGPDDLHGLDRDRDGLAYETLP